VCYTTFVHERLEWSLVDPSPDQSETEWLCVDIAGCKIVNVYKPPRSRLTPTTIPTFPHPSLYAGDINCQHVNTTSSMSTQQQHNIPGRREPGQHPTNLDCCTTQRKQLFFSCRWNVGTNPDLAFASFGQDSRLPDRRVLGKFRGHNIGPPS